MRLSTLYFIQLALDIAVRAAPEDELNALEEMQAQLQAVGPAEIETTAEEIEAGDETTDLPATTLAASTTRRMAPTVLTMDDAYDLLNAYNVGSGLTPKQTASESEEETSEAATTTGKPSATSTTTMGSTPAGSTSAASSSSNSEETSEETSSTEAAAAPERKEVAGFMQGSMTPTHREHVSASSAWSAYDGVALIAFGWCGVLSSRW